MVQQVPVGFCDLGCKTHSLLLTYRERARVLSALQSHAPLGRLKLWSDVGQVAGKLGKLGKPSSTAKKEWKIFKEGHRNSKFGAHLEPAARGPRSSWHMASHTPVLLLSSSSLWRWYHNSWQSHWVSQAGLVSLLTSCSGSCRWTCRPQSLSFCSFSWQGETQLDLHISSWVLKADWSGSKQATGFV